MMALQLKSVGLHSFSTRLRRDEIVLHNIKLSNSTRFHPSRVTRYIDQLPANATFQIYLKTFMTQRKSTHWACSCADANWIRKLLDEGDPTIHFFSENDSEL